MSFSAAPEERPEGEGKARRLACVCALNNFSRVCLLLSGQNKLKKIKEKYKDQDEEDRELMMQLLGVRKTRPHRSAPGSVRILTISCVSVRRLQGGEG